MAKFLGSDHAQYVERIRHVHTSTERSALSALAAFPRLRVLELNAFRLNVDLQPLVQLSALTSLTLSVLEEQFVPRVAELLHSSPLLRDVHLVLFSCNSEITIKMLQPYALQIKSLSFTLRDAGGMLELLSSFQSLTSLDLTYLAPSRPLPALPPLPALLALPPWQPPQVPLQTAVYHAQPLARLVPPPPAPWQEMSAPRALRLPQLSCLTELDVTCHDPTVLLTGIEENVQLRELRLMARIADLGAFTQLTNLVSLTCDRYTSGGLADAQLMSFLDGCSTTLRDLHVGGRRIKILLRHSRVSQLSCCDISGLFNHKKLRAGDLILVQKLTRCKLSLDYDIARENIRIDFVDTGGRLTSVCELSISINDDDEINYDAASIASVFPNLEILCLDWNYKGEELPSPLLQLRQLSLCGCAVLNRSLLRAITGFARLETLQLDTLTKDESDPLNDDDWLQLKQLRYLYRIALDFEYVANVRRLGLPAVHSC